MNEIEALPLPELVGRAALVTGAGRGLGRAIAVDLASAGAVVAVVARSQEHLADTLLEIDSNDGAAAAFVRDLAEPGAPGSLLADVERELGPIEILINNAGTLAPLGPTESLEPFEVEHSLRLNVVAPVVLSAMAIPNMRRRGWGRIVNVSSGVAANPRAMIGGNTYTLAKSALEAHTLNLAAELDGSGVTANIYRPGRVDAAMQEWIRGNGPKRVGGGPVERFRALDEAGELITPASSARSLVTRLSRTETGLVWDVAGDLTIDAAS